MSEVSEPLLDTLLTAVDDWKVRRDVLEAIAEPGSSPSPKVELRIVDLLVEGKEISIGIKARRCSRSATSDPGNRASSLFDELHAALHPGLPPPPASSQILRLLIFKSTTCPSRNHDLHRPVEAVDTLEIWRELRKARLIANGTRCGGVGLEVAETSFVAVEAVVLLEKSEGEGEVGWKEVGRVHLE
ncbi:hypothetical protein BCR35DRAFT_334156 [Leucosporidium creatinivorum]|uniref:Uncharacterized protein n=1 Tax=Leucosporidium creatinivorum TaxID=106004 RepID=A0A1Y2EGT3_9BASI|nr:hypothetical protein BCR35DRAFT_334156 [Leucosporidium creatinivorum]